MQERPLPLIKVRSSHKTTIWIYTRSFGGRECARGKICHRELGYQENIGLIPIIITNISSSSSSSGSHSPFTIVLPINISPSLPFILISYRTCAKMWSPTGIIAFIRSLRPRKITARFDLVLCDMMTRLFEHVFAEYVSVLLLCWRYWYCIMVRYMPVFKQDVWLGVENLVGLLYIYKKNCLCYQK